MIVYRQIVFYILYQLCILFVKLSGYIFCLCMNYNMLSLRKVRKMIQPSSDPDLVLFNLPHFFKHDSQNFTKKVIFVLAKNCFRTSMYFVHLFFVVRTQIWVKKISHHSKPSSGTELLGSFCFPDLLYA